MEGLLAPFDVATGTARPPRWYELKRSSLIPVLSPSHFIVEESSVLDHVTDSDAGAAGADAQRVSVMRERRATREVITKEPHATEPIAIHLATSIEPHATDHSAFVITENSVPHAFRASSTAERDLWLSFLRGSASGVYPNGLTAGLSAVLNWCIATSRVSKEGFMRLGGDRKRTVELTRAVIANEKYDLESEDPLVVGSVIKIILRRAPQSLFTTKLFEAFTLAATPAADAKDDTAVVNEISRLIGLLPADNRALLSLLVRMFVKLCADAVTRMKPDSLSTVVGPPLLLSGDVDSGFAITKPKLSLLFVAFVHHHSQLFPSQPLPAAAAAAASGGDAKSTAAAAAATVSSVAASAPTPLFSTSTGRQSNVSFLQMAEAEREKVPESVELANIKPASALDDAKGGSGVGGLKLEIDVGVSIAPTTVPASAAASNPHSVAAYDAKLKERLARAANAIAAAESAISVSPRSGGGLSGSVSPRAAGAGSGASSGRASGPGRKIVLGPSVSDAVTRLSAGFQLNMYRLHDQKEGSRRPYTVWFSASDRALLYAAGSLKFPIPGQRLPLGDVTHLYFGTQTKAFRFVNLALGGDASGAAGGAGSALKPELCFSILSPKITLDFEANNRTDFRHFLACLNTILESFGKLTFLESNSVPATGAAPAETRRFRVVAAAETGDDDPLDVTSTASATSSGLPSVWVSPNETRIVFPAPVGVNGFRAESGQPLNSDITMLSGITAPVFGAGSSAANASGFRNPHMFELAGRGKPVRIHVDPNGKEEAVEAARAVTLGTGADPSEFDPVSGKHLGVIVGADGQPLQISTAATVDSEEDNDSDSDLENDPVHPPLPPAQQKTTAPANSAAPAVATTTAVVPAETKPAPPAVRTDALAGPLVHGIVWKQSGTFIRKWEPRYIVLQGRFVFKYEHPESSIASLLGHPIPLDQCVIELANEIKSQAEPNSTTAAPVAFFRLSYTPSIGGAIRVWELGVTSVEARAKWMTALNTARALITEKVAGRVAWTEADKNANRIADLALHTSHQ